MPVVWNAETEARLLAGLFKVCDIKVSAQQLKELAELIGPDCTPKAVTHRIARFRKMAGSFNGGRNGGAAAAEEADDVDGETPKRGKKGGKGGKGSKKRVVEEDDEADEETKKPKLEVEDEE